MRRLLSIFFAVAVLASAPTANAALEAYRVMPGSQFDMDLGSTFNDVGLDFIVGTLVKVNVVNSQVVSFRFDEVVVNAPAVNIEIQPDNYANVRVVNNVEEGMGTLKALTPVTKDRWLKSSQIPEGQWVKAKPEGFFQGYYDGVPRFSADIWPRGRETNAYLNCVHTTYFTPARSELPVCEGERRKLGFGGFIKARGSFGGPFQLDGIAAASTVYVRMDIFGKDWTTYVGFGTDFAQALPWVTGTARARAGNRDAPGNPDNWDFGSYKAGQVSVSHSKYGLGNGLYFTTTRDGAVVTKNFGNWNRNTAIRPDTMALHTGQAPVFNPNGAAEYGWAVEPGQATKIKVVGTATEMRNGYKQLITGGNGNVSRSFTYTEVDNKKIVHYNIVAPGEGTGWGTTTHMARLTETVSSQPLAADTVTITLVSPAIVNPAVAMNLVGEITFRLQKVPEPTTPILLAVSAFTIAGLGFIKRKKS